MKNEIDILTAVAGGAGSFIKGKKRKRPFKTLTLDVLLGIILGYLTIGVLDYFTSGQSPKVIMLVSFSVGWVANELTDLLEKLVVGAYDVIIGFFKKYSNSKIEENEEVIEPTPEILKEDEIEI